MPLTTLTAWEALTESLAICPEKREENKHKRVLITGGAGGVGSIAIQLAKRVLHLTVITTASRPESEAFARKMGADYILDHSKNLVDECRKQNLIKCNEVNEPLGAVDFILHTNDMDYMKQFGELLLPTGRLCMITPSPSPVDLSGIYFMKRLSVCKEMMFSRSDYLFDMERQGQALEKVSNLSICTTPKLE
jgi:NADPH2:quinone reductase